MILHRQATCHLVAKDVLLSTNAKWQLDLRYYKGHFPIHPDIGQRQQFPEMSILVYQVRR